MKGGRQAVPYRFRAGIQDPNAISAQRAAQDAFGSQRSGGIQIASKNSTLDASADDIIIVENTSTATGARPVIRLPKVTAALTGKRVTVTFGTKSTTAQYTIAGSDAINSGTPGMPANMTISSPTRVHLYLAISPDYGWRQVALTS